MMPLRLHFVRHGESLANEADKAGRERPADWDGLSGRGWEQARGLGRRLEGHGIELIVASTMRRAQETARGINEVLGLPVETDPDLHELKQSDAFYGSRGDFRDADRVARASEGLGQAMTSLETRKLEEQQLLANRGW